MTMLAQQVATARGSSWAKEPTAVCRAVVTVLLAAAVLFAKWLKGHKINI